MKSTWIGRGTNLAIFILGAILSFICGCHGMHPLDSSIVFDGAWRLCSGQQFFHEFATPAGFTPIWMQSILFRLTGPGWYSYLFHAAVLNGLFGVLVREILRMQGLGLTASAIYGALSTVVLYPPMGVPYLEQHAFFFLVLGFWLLIMGLREAPRNRWVLLLVPVTVSLAILSKQQPGLFGIPLTAFVYLSSASRTHWKSDLGMLGIGMIVALLPFWAAMGWNLENMDEFWYHTWTLPGQIGAQRMASWSRTPYETIRTFFWYPFEVFPEQIPILENLVYLPFLGLFVEGVIRRIKRLPLPDFRVITAPALGLMLLLTSSFFLHFSQNQPQNGLALFFLSIGLYHAGGASQIRSWFADLPLSVKRVSWILSGGLLGACVFYAVTFHLAVNETRMVLDFSESQPYQPVPQANDIPGLIYDAPFQYHDLQPGVLVKYLQQRNENFFLFGDMTFLYGLTGKTNPFPALWIHPGLCYPAPSDPGFGQFDEELTYAVQKMQPAMVIFENSALQTYLHVRLSDFPKLEVYLRSYKIDEEPVGGFLIWHLSP